MDEDLGRYKSAAGWRRPDIYKKRREKLKAKQEIEDRLSEPILHIPHGDKVIAPENIFTTLWRAGEVALLFGAPGVGKSLFAVRLAEAITNGNAAGRNADTPVRMSEANLLAAEHADGPGNVGCQPASSRRVIYIDLQRTESQFQQRFPNTNIDRRHFDWSSHDADDTDSIRAKRVHSSISQVIEDGADVVILDDITLGGINIGRPNGPLRSLRTLKMFAATSGTAILVIAGARQRKRPRPASLSDVAYRHIAEQADSVFCLSASTYGPAFRYIRHLRSASGPIIHDATAVLTFQLSSPPYEGGVAAASADGVVLSCPEFKYLGDCAESDHVRDYATEALRESRDEEQKRRRLLKQSSKAFLVEGMLDGRYQRYLKGE